MLTALRVRAYLSAPIAAPRSNDLHLDAILAWSWIVRHCPDRLNSISRYTTHDEIVHYHLGLATIAGSGSEIALASAWMFPVEARLSTTSWTRRKDGEDFDQRARRINASSNDRASLSRCDIIETPFVEWMAWGKRRYIRDALRIVHHIGGLRAHGYGRVRSWMVDNADFVPRETWIDGVRLRRNLPSAFIEAHDPEELVGVRAPYWVPALQVPGMKAGRRASLTESTEAKIINVC